MTASESADRIEEVREWPPNYRGRFWSDRMLSYRVSLVLAFLGAIDSIRSRSIALAIIIASVSAGALIGVGLKFTSGWALVASIPLCIAVVSALSAVVSYPSRSNLGDQYRPGTQVRVAVSDAAIEVSLNRHLIVYQLSDIARLWNFGSLVAIEFRDGKCVVLPRAFIPNRNPMSQAQLRRWGPPKERVHTN
jgi:hypothetical protein